VAPSVQHRKVWLTPTTRVPCSNAAKTRKFAALLRAGNARMSTRVNYGATRAVAPALCIAFRHLPVVEPGRTRYTCRRHYITHSSRTTMFYVSPLASYSPYSTLSHALYDHNRGAHTSQHCSRTNSNKNSSGDEIANVNFFYSIAHVDASAYAH